MVTILFPWRTVGVAGVSILILPNQIFECRLIRRLKCSSTQRAITTIVLCRNSIPLNF